jgi:3-hydroxybutyryl-CoA dehydrogenase
MNQPEFKKVGVIGTGVMGRGIVQVLAQAGSSVIAYDMNPGQAQSARDQAIGMIEKLAAKGKIAAQLAASAPQRISIAMDLGDLADCSLVVEAVAEDLEIKRTLFRQLEEIVSSDCVLATNTSSLPVTAIAAGCDRPERVAGFHFFNPVPLMKVVEVIPGLRTDPQVTARLTAYAEAFGHRAVATADTPGFLVNHAGRGLTTEGLRIVQEQIAEPRVVDRILEDAAGFRLGPFALLDLTGLDVSSKVFHLIYDGFLQEPRFRPSPLAELRVAAGLYGRKSGEGFYRYREGTREPFHDEVPHVFGSAPAIWLGGVDAPFHEEMTALFSGSQFTIDDGISPAPDSAVILAPVGHDLTHECFEKNVDPARALGIDPLFGSDDEGRITLMACPATRHAIRDAVHAGLARNRPVSVIADSPGFVCQRVVAMIVNIACDIAQQAIATPRDIDDAVRLGLGYPQGPLSWGDALGPATILTILERLHSFYGDPRYRPSPWLTRRARLGLSLLDSGERRQAVF